MLALVMALFSFFLNASLPQFEAVTFSHLGLGVQDYSRVRLWGSVGFILVVSGVGVLVDLRDPSVVPQVLLLCFVAIWLSSLPVPERGGPRHPAAQEAIWQVIPAADAGGWAPRSASGLLIRDTLSARPSAFFSVNLVARKPHKNTPETNPYTKAFVAKSPWQPKLLGVFGGDLDYQRYSAFDRNVIRFIMWLTKGPTDPSTKAEYTNWDEVERFAQRFADLAAAG